MNSNWSYGPKTVKWGCDLCDLDLWPLTLNFCMDITCAIDNNSRKFHDDTMMETQWKMCHRQTDRRTGRRTDRRTDGRTDLAIHRAAWSLLKTKQTESSTYIVQTVWLNKKLQCGTSHKCRLPVIVFWCGLVMFHFIHICWLAIKNVN